MSKGLKIFSIVLFAITAVLAVLFYMNSESENMVNAILYFAYFLLGLGILLALVLPIPSLIQYPKKIKKLLFTLLIVLAVFAIGYLLSSGNPVDVNTDVPPTERALKLTDTALIITYITLGVSFAAIAWGGIKNLVQKIK
ncbi:MAG: hypothetical protein PHP30_01365 [Bacteroidales bacterium]|nr:hypothetical protein [Bacteroidales bacterium]MDD2424590.1 hypothetical protein [Bacteroidales bacterium]MDD3988736.1 hypothetical protein [Bacteroidales bacterium]